MRTHRLTGLLLLALLAACNRSSAPTGVNAGGTHYDADITRTAFGIPHVKAADWGSLGFGLGYAFAEDNLCALMEDLVTIRGERAKYFGGDGTYLIPANGSNPNNVDSDFFWKLVNTDAAIMPLKKAALPEARAGTIGYKDGFNRYIRELKAGQHPGRHADCASKPYLAEISEDDMYRRYFRLALLASSSVFAGGIAQAQPPLPGVANRAPKSLTRTQLARIDRSQFPLTRELPIGSNMYAIGPDGTADGSSIQFVNPHFPWQGTERLYMSHLTIPGKVDIMGSSLYGVPALLIGFNDHLAWSHTVSSAYRFTFYELTLAPGDPTSYVYNGAVMKMTAVPLSVEVKAADGSLSTVKRTLYKSKYGPMLTFTVSGANILPWSTSKAYTLRDANAENDRLINQFFLWDQAKNLTEFKALHKSVLGVPWVNTTATGPGETAYYGDVTVVPNVPDAKVQLCSTSVQAQALAQLAPGLPLLDGSRTDCEWDTDADAPAPGIFGPSHLPTLERRDWVGNNNDSYWLTNPAAPIEGYNKIIGAERSTRSLRTRHSILKMLNRFAGTDGKPGNKWNTELLKDSVLDSHIYSGDLARDKVFSDLCATGTAPTSSGAPVDVSAACTVLKNWDLSDNVDAVGSHIWLEFWRKGAAATGFYTTPFSAADPVNTPRDIDTASPQVQSALGDAVKTFNDLAIPMNARYGSIHHSGVNGDDIEIFGGEGNLEGAFTIGRGPAPGSPPLNKALDKDGYHVTYGNSHVEVATWDANGVKVDGFITYSQSTDPANPHFSDFTKEYSAKRWHRFPYHEAEVRAAEVSRIHISE
jgi:acyl-homoserine-lactone acylase